MEIHWLGIQSRTGFLGICHHEEFNVFDEYLIQLFQWVLKMPHFLQKWTVPILRPSSTYFNLVTVVFQVTLLVHPA